MSNPYEHLSIGQQFKLFGLNLLVVITLAASVVLYLFFVGMGVAYFLNDNNVRNSIDFWRHATFVILGANSFEKIGMKLSNYIIKFQNSLKSN